jgi:hypothetical protein
MENGLAEVVSDKLRFTLDLDRGAVVELSAGEKRLIAANGAPPLFATLMESAEYDGVRDFVPRRFLDAAYSCERFSVESDDSRFTATGRGALAFPDGDALEFTIQYRAEEGSPRFGVRVTLAKRGEFKDRFIREAGLRLPLALDHRKRVVQAGDQGLRWDTRHHYQFHMTMGAGDELLGAPDTNWWRHFYVDQESDHSYRIWRAECAETAGVQSFVGRRVAGWMTLYDRTGGALIACRALAERAPKTLYANARGGGKAVLYLHPPTQPAADPADPRLDRSLFGEPHEIDFIFFEGEESALQPDRLLADLWGVKELPSDGPTRFRPIIDEVDLWNVPAAQSDLAPMVAGGMPLPRGAIASPDQARLFTGDREVPCQTVPIAFWPDRSIKWLLLTFPLDGGPGLSFAPGAGEGDEARFNVTLRKGGPVEFRLRFGKNVRAGNAGGPLAVSLGRDLVTIDTGPLAVTLSEGERWMPSARIHGREMVRNDGLAQAVVDFIRTGGKPVYPVGTTHPEGVADDGPVRIERIEIEEAGPLRAVVRIEGRALCIEPARIILRLEFYRGRSYVRVTHSVEFMQKGPREVFVRRLALRIPLSMDGADARVAAGGQEGPVELPPGATAGLRQTNHLHYEIWRAAGRRREIVESNHLSRGWLDVRDRGAGLAVIQRGMWQEAPKELLFDATRRVLEIGLWPASAPMMDVRRYSLYPHRSQGESVPDDDMRWVLDDYYPNEPFTGVSRTHETMLFFHDAAASLDDVESVAADFNGQPLLHAGWPWYAETGVTMPLPPPDAPEFARFNAAHDDLFSWWLYHQKCYGWYGFWDYGDVGHKFRDGYGCILPPDELEKALQLPPAERVEMRAKGFHPVQDYFTQNDWAYDNGRWGWSNTEGLLNLAFAMQYLRTGRRELFFFMEAYARHARDVDVRHAGLWFGKGTRHGVQHWSDGNHEERQTTFTEYRHHYLLTGEPRTREWSGELTARWYMRTASITSATHGGRSYGLLFNWEITGDPRVGAALRQFMRLLAQPEGIATRPVVMFPQVALIGELRAMNSDDFFFHSFGAMHAMLDYVYLTGDERVRDAILAMARAVGSPADETRKVLAFAARHAPERETYRRMIEEYALGKGIKFVFRQVPANREHWSGPGAYLAGNVSGGLFWLSSAPYLLGALDREPALPPDRLRALDDAESGPRLPEPRAPQGAWQSEYDERPELKGFLTSLDGE